MILDLDLPPGIMISSYNFPHVNISRYLAYLQRGLNSGMSYLSRPESVLKRESPYLIAPWVKSVLIFDFLYKLDLQNKTNGPRFSMYSQLEDYHSVATNLINKFVNEYSLFNEHMKIYVDTGPVMEKELASKSGIGWIGKNSMLINRKLGSFTFLGEAFLDMKLDIPLEIQNDLCGKCDLCIRACPVNAIDENRMVDGRKCLSYHTIESKEVIPFELGRKMDNWVFGCDICNMVCPWNKVSKGEGIFKVNNGVRRLGIEDLVYLTKDEFLRIFSKTPVTRAKLAGLRRNAVMVHFNINNDDAFLRDVSRSFSDLGGKQAEEILRNI